MIKSGYKSAVKKFEQAVEAGKVEDAKVLLSEATKKIDQACTKGVIVKNTASRKKSALAKKLKCNECINKKLCTVFYLSRIRNNICLLRFYFFSMLIAFISSAFLP